MSFYVGKLYLDEALSSMRTETVQKAASLFNKNLWATTPGVLGLTTPKSGNYGDEVLVFEAKRRPAVGDLFRVQFGTLHPPFKRHHSKSSWMVERRRPNPSPSLKKAVARNILAWSASWRCKGLSLSCDYWYQCSSTNHDDRYNIRNMMDCYILLTTDTY